MGKFIFGSIIIATLFLAALKNPSRTEAKDEIQTMIVDGIMDKMRKEITDESDNVWEQIGSGISMFFASTIIDNMVETEVSDYVFFSTFDTSVTVDEKKRTLVGGIIVFGKVIPLKSGIKEDFLSEIV